MKFDSLNLDKRIIDATRESGYVRCTPVQEQALPESLAGNDLIAQSQTGTGKTAVFLITIIQRLLSSGDSGGTTRALILAPTRELAVQVEQVARDLCKYLPYRTVSVYGGVGYDEQERKLNSGTEIVIATPGRLIDFIKTRKLDLKGVSFFIIDEADRMFDMGFMPDVRFIMGKIPSRHKRQTMIFSATLDSQVRRLAEQFMRKPVEIEIDPNQITVDTVNQKVFHVSREEKLPLLLTLLSREKMPKVLIFTNMKRTAERLCFKLQGNGFRADVITGDIEQKKRLRVIEKLKSGQTSILVATDVAARGLHVDGISHVINYDVPNAAPNYVHRIGRTARAGAKGTAYTIACEDFVEHLPDVENFIEQKIEVEFIDFDLLKDKAGPYRPGRGRKPTHQGDRKPMGRDKKTDARQQSTRAKAPLLRGRERQKPKAKAEKLTAPKRKMSREERLEYYRKKYGESFQMGFSADLKGGD